MCEGSHWHNLRAQKSRQLFSKQGYKLLRNQSCPLRFDPNWNRNIEQFQYKVSLSLVKSIPLVSTNLRQQTRPKHFLSLLWDSEFAKLSFQWSGVTNFKLLPLGTKHVGAPWTHKNKWNNPITVLQSWQIWACTYLLVSLIVLYTYTGTVHYIGSSNEIEERSQKFQIPKDLRSWNWTLPR